MADLAGETIGPYRVLERLGRGGMADVYKAFHTRLEIHRAIKFIRPEFVAASDFRARFEKEAQAVAQLRHPGIVQVHDFGEHAGAYFMVMEYVEGRSLDAVVASEGRIRPIARAVGLVSQVAAALEYAHARGLIHRDIKPQNIMVTAEGQAILMDFGIARLTQESGTRLTQTGVGIGTPAYMAPEQALGTQELGPAADIYALCIVLYELLTGQVPFAADTPIAAMLKALRDPMPLPRTLSPDIGEALQAVVLKGSAKDPAARYPDVAALRAALQAALASDAATPDTAATLVRSPAAPTVPGPASGAAKRALPSRAVASVALLLVAGTVAGVWSLVRDTSEPTAPARQLVPTSPSPAAAAAPPATAPAAERVAPPPPAAARGTAQPTATAARSGAGAAKSRAALAADSPGTATPARDANSSAAPVVEARPVVEPPSPTGLPPDPLRVANKGPEHIVRGETTQAEILSRFGGPNVRTRDRAGLEVWVYQREATQTQFDAWEAGSARGAGVGGSVGAWGDDAGLSGGASRASRASSGGSTTTSATMMVTVTVTFAPDRTVRDLQVRRRRT